MSSKGHYSTCNPAAFPMPHKDSESTLIMLTPQKTSSNTRDNNCEPLLEQENHSSCVSIRPGSECNESMGTLFKAAYSNATFRRDSAQERPLPAAPYSNDNVNRPDLVRSIPPEARYANDKDVTITCHPSMKSSGNDIARAKRCTYVSLTCILLSLILSGTSTYLAVVTYRDAVNFSQMQSNDVGSKGDSPDMTSAHVRLNVNGTNPGSKSITQGSNFQLSIMPTGKGHAHCQNVRCGRNSLGVVHAGWYFVYSSINFNYNDIEGGCDKLPYQTWLHHVILDRSGTKSALLRTEQTCCAHCNQYRTSGFTGGIFRLEPGDKILVIVSAAPIVVYDKESSYLGLFMVDD